MEYVGTSANIRSSHCDCNLQMQLVVFIVVFLRHLSEHRYFKLRL